jgi:hypothetical protein
MTTPALNAYLTTRYLYHWICMTCGNVHHSRPGVGGDECVKCGGCCWTCLVVSPKVNQPWYVQILDTASCATCRQTLATLNGIDAQLELFIVGG